MIYRINESKSWFFEKINKTDKPLHNLTKRKMEKTQNNKIGHGKGYYDKYQWNPENCEGIPSKIYIQIKSLNEHKHKILHKRLLN
jgi:hypothetical protein